MNSPNLSHQHLVGSTKKTATLQVSTTPEQDHAKSAPANDTPVTGRQSWEPLFNLAIVLMALCGVAVLVIAFS